ncbi:hypothetical protein AMTR_s00038p00239200 [Amborella trichopoda]|uniref:Uncharacterized protein n=1 Tax=Amborella trichopoda TaxID=13333 RepID=U5D032_AMBTC|nr:hypothetical protein AMTR_s00038p00239200 [Amborella trichopoda]
MRTKLLKKCSSDIGAYFEVHIGKALQTMKEWCKKKKVEIVVAEKKDGEINKKGIVKDNGKAQAWENDKEKFTVLTDNSETTSEDGAVVDGASSFGPYENP